MGRPAWGGREPPCCVVLAARDHALHGDYGKRRRLLDVAYLVLTSAYPGGRERHLRFHGGRVAGAGHVTVRDAEGKHVCCFARLGLPGG